MLPGAEEEPREAGQGTGQSSVRLPSRSCASARLDRGRLGSQGGFSIAVKMLSSQGLGFGHWPCRARRRQSGSSQCLWLCVCLTSALKRTCAPSLWESVTWFRDKYLHGFMIQGDACDSSLTASGRAGRFRECPLNGSQEGYSGEPAGWGWKREGGGQAGRSQVSRVCFLTSG